MDNVTEFKHLKRICLKHYGESYLLGISPDGTCYVEEFYDDSYVAQHEISEGGTIIRSTDEDYGQKTYRPIPLPPGLRAPERPNWHKLNYKGLRDRGLRQEEKVESWVQALPLTEKLPLLKALEVSTPPMMILGIAESKVLSHASISQREVLICRRLKLLRALPEIRFDESGLPFDYDTLVCHVLQAYDPVADDITPLHVALHRFAQVSNPSDVILHGKRLIVTSNSDGVDVCAVHIFEYDELPRQ